MQQNRENGGLPPTGPTDQYGKAAAGASRERITIICPDCGDVTTVEKTHYLVGTIFANSAPPACTQCGEEYQILPYHR